MQKRIKIGATQTTKKFGEKFGKKFKPLKIGAHL